MKLTYRLILLVALALVPTIAIEAYNAFDLRRAREAEVHAQALRQAQLAASELERIFEGVRNLLTAIAEVPSVRDLHTPDCVGFLADLQRKVPHLLAVTAADLDGRMICRQVPPPAASQIGDRPYFQAALATGGFVIGEYTLERVSGVPALPLAMPLRDSDGRITGVVAAALDLDWLSDRLRERAYAEDSALVIADRHGVILARQPFPEQFVGTTVADEFLYLLRADAAGSLALTGRDGTHRIVGYKPVTLPPRDIYVGAGIATETAFADIRRATWRGVALIALGLLIAFGAAWLAGRHLVSGPVAALLAATDAWRQGNVAVRTGLSSRRDEIGALGQAVDGMMDEIAARQAERDRANAAVLASEERFRLMARASSEVIWEWDVAENRVFWGDNFAAVVGHPPERVNPVRAASASAAWDNWDDLIHPDDRARVQASFARTIEERKEFWEEEFRFLRPDGYGWLLERDCFIYDNRGELTRIVGSLIDTTKRKQAEAALVASEARFRTMADSAPAIIWLDDAAGRCTYVNKTWCDFTGRSEADGLGEGWSELVHPVDRTAFRAALRAAIDGQDHFRAEYRMLRHDGAWCWMIDTAAPLFDDDGTFQGLVGLAIDITDQKNATEELARLNAVLEARVTERTAQLLQAQKIETLGQLTGGIAHDFNNLLAAVLGNLSLLRKRFDHTPDALRLIDNAAEGAKRGAALTQRLLAFARRQDLRLDAIDLPKLVDGLLEMVRRSIGPSIHVTSDMPPDLWPVRADANQTEMAILNLAVNARDAMPTGGTLALSARNETIAAGGNGDLAPGDYVVLAVADTGMGMSAEILARATEPFFTTKGVGKGTGLGLSMVHGVCAQLGGVLRLSSQVGRGTVAELWLPRADTAASAVSRPDPAPKQTRRCTVLLVDDDILIAMATAEILRDLGHEVLEAASGKEALEILADGTDVDVVVTDHAMPGMTGLQLATAIRASRPGLPIILATGYADLPGQAGAEYPRLSKPYDEDDLAAAIAAAVRSPDRAME